MTHNFPGYGLDKNMMINTKSMFDINKLALNYSQVWGEAELVARLHQIIYLMREWEEPVE